MQGLPGLFHEMQSSTTSPRLIEKDWTQRYVWSISENQNPFSPNIPITNSPVDRWREYKLIMTAHIGFTLHTLFIWMRLWSNTTWSACLINQRDFSQAVNPRVTKKKCSSLTHNRFVKGLESVTILFQTSRRSKDNAYCSRWYVIIQSWQKVRLYGGDFVIKGCLPWAAAR